MAFRKRRRSRGTWLPLDPTFYGESIQGKTFYTEIDVVSFENAPGTHILGVQVPIAQDETRSNDGTQSQGIMRDLVEGQEYYLDRIVGKVWCALGQNQDTFTSSVLVGMGLAVFPVDDGSGAPALQQGDMDVLNVDNAMAPWIWRRTWVLANNLATPAQFYYPTATTAYGSVMDGGHVDAKTKRRIRKEQRLFWCMDVYQTSDLAPGGSQNAIDYGFDLRLHGAMRRASNRSTFK